MTIGARLLLLFVIISCCFYPPQKGSSQIETVFMPTSQDSLSEVFYQEVHQVNTSIRNVEQEQSIIQLQNQLHEATIRSFPTH